MKTSRLLLAFVFLLTILALAIAIPSIVFKWQGGYKLLRGLDPKDIKQDYLLQEFGLQPALDLKGGMVATYTLDMSTYTDKEEALKKFDEARNIFIYRVEQLDIEDYQISSLINQESGVYKIVLKLPQGINNAQLASLATKGEVTAWVQDTTQLLGTESETATEEQDPLKGTPYEGRQLTDLSNSDLMGARVISDSRIFLSTQVVQSSPDQSIFGKNPFVPSNYGVEIYFKEEAELKMLNLIASNYLGATPVIFAVDGIPVAYHASGQTFTQNSIGNKLLLYTLVPDTSLDNSVVAAVLNSPALEPTMNLESVKPIDPLFGDSVIDIIKLAFLVSFILGQAVIVYYFRERSIFVLASNGIFLIWSIAILKIFGFFSLTLSFPLLLGYLLAMICFFAFMLLLMYRLRSKFSAGLTASELGEVHKITVTDYRNWAICAVIIAFIMLFYGTLQFKQFANGLGFGTISGLLVFGLAVKATLPLIFFKFKK